MCVRETERIKEVGKERQRKERREEKVSQSALLEVENETVTERQRR